jgi:hypothetical protein
MNVDTTNTPTEWNDFIFERNYINIAPIGSEFDDLGKGSYRVPVRIEGAKHTVFVGDEHLRIFDYDTLPTFIKHKLSMIIVSSNPEVLFMDTQLSRLELFKTQGDTPLIGWRASNTMYIVIMTDAELESLKGYRE